MFFFFKQMSSSSKPELSVNVEADDDNGTTTTTFDDSIDKEYSVYIGNTRVMNIPPRIFLSFILSFFLTVISVIYVFINPDKSTLVFPFLSMIVGVWIPSPMGSTTTKTDALQNAAMLKFNMQTTSKLIESKDQHPPPPPPTKVVGEF